MADRLIAKIYLTDEQLGELEQYVKQQVEELSRPKGKWLKHKTKSNKNWWKCSQCGYVAMKRYPYCAICGADTDMRGEESDKDIL